VCGPAIRPMGGRSAGWSHLVEGHEEAVGPAQGVNRYSDRRVPSDSSDAARGGLSPESSISQKRPEASRRATRPCRRPPRPGAVAATPPTCRIVANAAARSDRRRQLRKKHPLCEQRVIVAGAELVVEPPVATRALGGDGNPRVSFASASTPRPTGRELSSRNVNLKLAGSHRRPGRFPVRVRRPSGEAQHQSERRSSTDVDLDPFVPGAGPGPTPCPRRDRAPSEPVAAAWGQQRNFGLTCRLPFFDTVTGID
jgi:hypothetical protein